MKGTADSVTRSRVCLLLLPIPIPYINSPSAFPSPPRCRRCLPLSPIPFCVTSYLHITQVIRLTVLLFLVGDDADGIGPGYAMERHGVWGLVGGSRSRAIKRECRWMIARVVLTRYESS
jgi:hypothetical protein